jgi:hypothetical protein
MSLIHGAGPIDTEQIVLQGHVGWLMQVDREVGGGAFLENDAWVSWNPPCSQVGGLAVIAASDPEHLVAVCDEGLYDGAGPQAVGLYLSDDGGSTFRLAATSPSPSNFGPPISSPAPGIVIMAGRGGDLIGTFDGGTTLIPVYHQAMAYPWAYIGFTTASQGVAVNQSGTVVMTFDGGHKWTPVVFPSVRL